MRSIITNKDNEAKDSKQNGVITKEKNVLWIDIEKPTEKDYEYLKNNYNFHDLHLEHCKNKSRRAKIDECSHYIFLVLTTLNKTTSVESIVFSTVYIFLGEDYIITLHDEKNKVISELREVIDREPWILDKGADFILYNIFKEVVDQYFKIVDKLEERIDFIQDEVMDNPSKEALNKIMDLKRKLIKLRKHIYPKREILTTMLRVESNIFKPENKTYFSDIYDHILIIHDMMEGNKEMLSACLELYSSQLSNKTNDVMKFLTIITTIMMPITIVTGIYGMNFEFMPELGFKYSYLVFWIIIILSIIIQLRYFKKKKWL